MRTKNIRPVDSLLCSHCDRLQSSDGRTAVYNLITQTVTIGCEYGDCAKENIVPSKGVRIRCATDPSCAEIDTLGVSYHDHDLNRLFGGN